jgi:2OG-Fe(II) oxygenase superfamily
MLNDYTVELLEALSEGVSLDTSLTSLRESYHQAKPFPHLVLDNVFSPALLDRVANEAPPMSGHQWVNIEHEDLERVVRMRSAVEMGPASREFTALLHSPAFLYLLSEITGVWQLLPDPYLQGGGHAVMRRGGFFEVHADINVAYDTGLRRRMALLVFLNKDWRSEYNGQLELWSNDASRCEVSIEPRFNRVVLFEVAFPNYHGVPAPLTCPPEAMRHTFLTYFHTADLGEYSKGNRTKPHSSLFAPRFYRGKKSWLRRLAFQLMPPAVTRFIQARRHGRAWGLFED